MFEAINSKNKICNCEWRGWGGVLSTSTLSFNNLPTWLKCLKKLHQIQKKCTKTRSEWNEFDRFWIIFHILYKFMPMEMSRLYLKLHKIIINEPPAIYCKTIDSNPFVWTGRYGMDSIHTIFCWLYAYEYDKNICLVQSKYIKSNKK